MAYIILRGEKFPQLVDSYEIKEHVVVAKVTTKKGRVDTLTFPLINVPKILDKGQEE